MKITLSIASSSFHYCGPLQHIVFLLWFCCRVRFVFGFISFITMRHLTLTHHFKLIYSFQAPIVYYCIFLKPFCIGLILCHIWNILFSKKTTVLKCPSELHYFLWNWKNVIGKINRVGLREQQIHWNAVPWLTFIGL